MNNKNKFSGLVNSQIGVIADFNNFTFTSPITPLDLGIIFNFSQIVIEFRMLTLTGTLQGTAPDFFYTFENGVYNFKFEMLPTAAGTGVLNPLSIISFPFNYSVAKSQVSLGTPGMDDHVINYNQFWNVRFKQDFVGNQAIQLQSKIELFNFLASVISKDEMKFVIRLTTKRYYQSVVAPMSCQSANLRMFGVLKD